MVDIQQLIEVRDDLQRKVDAMNTTIRMIQRANAELYGESEETAPDYSAYTPRRRKQAVTNGPEPQAVKPHSGGIRTDI